MIVFIDECGDAGFKIEEQSSSRYFVIALVVFADVESSAKTEQVIAKLHQELGIRQEFKFCHDSRKTKLKVFNALRDCDFTVELLVVDKKLIESKYLREHPKNFYNFMLKEIISHSEIADAKAKIVLDGKGNKHFVNELKSYLRKDNKVQMKSFSLKDSKKDNLLQLADYVAGGIMCCYKHNNDDYKKLLGKKIARLWEFK